MLITALKPASAISILTIVSVMLRLISVFGNINKLKIHINNTSTSW